MSYFILILFFIWIGLLLIPFANAQVCNVSLDQSSFDFGNLNPNSESIEQSLTLDNLGSSSAQISTFGHAWIDLSSLTQMNTENTAYSIGTSSYDSKTKLSDNAVLVSSMASSSQLNLFYQVFSSLINPNFNGQISQVISVSVFCP